MTQFAFVLSDVVQSLVTVEATEELTAQQVADMLVSQMGYDRAEDVTGMDLMPQPGWVWPDGETPTPGQLPPDVCTRYVDKWEVLERFSEAEWEVIANHASSKAIAFRTWLLACGPLCLDDPRLINALDAMVSAGILAANRPDEIRGIA